MSHESVITDLKGMLKTRVIEITARDYAEHLQGESDRAKMILVAATVEDFLVRALEERMPSLNRDERNRLFQYEGPVGSFSNRIRLAQALGIIDRPTKRTLEIIKEVRNVAAHAHLPVSFETSQVRNAVMAIVPPRFRATLEKMTPRQMAYVYTQICVSITNDLMENEPFDIEKIFTTAASTRSGRSRPSPDKSQSASLQTHPERAKKGKLPPPLR